MDEVGAFLVASLVWAGLGLLELWLVEAYLPPAGGLTEIMVALFAGICIAMQCAAWVAVKIAPRVSVAGLTIWLALPVVFVLYFDATGDVRGARGAHAYMQDLAVAAAALSAIAMSYLVACALQARERQRYPAV